MSNEDVVKVATVVPMSQEYLDDFPGRHPVRAAAVDRPPAKVLPLRRRLLFRDVRKIRARAARKERLAEAGCARHQRDGIVVLWDEPNGNNPRKHLGFVCLACKVILTPRCTVSEPTVAIRPKVPASPRRPSRAHAARLRAVDRLGIVVPMEPEAA